MSRLAVAPPLPASLEYPTDPEDPVSLYGCVQSTEEALDLFDRAHSGTVRVLRQHLTAEDKDRIAPGHVFVFDSSRIERWTDNRTWSKAYSTKAGWLIYNEAEYVIERSEGDAEGVKVRRRKAGGMSKKIIIDKLCPSSTLRLVCYFSRPTSGNGEGEVPEAAAYSQTCVYGGESPYVQAPVSPRSYCDSLPTTPRGGGGGGGGGSGSSSSSSTTAGLKRPRASLLDEYDTAPRYAEEIYCKQPLLDVRHATLSHAPRAHSAGRAPNDSLVPDADQSHAIPFWASRTLFSPGEVMRMYPKLNYTPRESDDAASTVTDIEDELRMECALAESHEQLAEHKDYAGLSAFIEDAPAQPLFGV